jgi:hypothetical protein
LLNDREHFGRSAIALYDFFTGDGRSLFLHRKVDRPLLLFYGRRAIALFASKGRSPFTTFSQVRAIALLASKGRDPFTTFSRVAGDRFFENESFWQET